ncbi:MAG TPA: DNA recombination protein RmuC, partial [Terriglobales bacterium]|nr:DNA recombination protein RmuC [Terriglobales bacterium]
NLIVMAFAAGSALLSFITLLRLGRIRRHEQITAEQLVDALRTESDRNRHWADERERALRTELGDGLRAFQELTLKTFGQLGDRLGADVKEFGNNLNLGLQGMDSRADAIGKSLNQGVFQIRDDANKAHTVIRQNVEAKLELATTAQTTAARELRDEVSENIRRLGAAISETINDLGGQQKERLDNVTAAISMLSEKNERSQDALKKMVQDRLDLLRNENSAKLDEMRNTVDEKLQSTLDTRLGESLKGVVEQLERVHSGIGEMQTLAAGVGDLKRALSNVRVRGTFGEVQLNMLLEQVLSPEQFACNVQIKEGSQERVEFAIRLPGRNDDAEVLLPVDAKFPREDFERIITASELGDAEAVAKASRELENRIRQCARTIQEKYISSPRTTDFAILFLPTESLYAEVLRRPGLFEQIQFEYHVTLAGPTTLTALLNALQMGFRSLKIEKRSSEVWQILAAVKTQFGKYNVVVDGLSRQLNKAAKSVETLGVRTRVMNRALRDVETAPDETVRMVLGDPFAASEAEEELDGEVDVPV